LVQISACAGLQSWDYALSRSPPAYILLTAAAAAPAQPGGSFVPSPLFPGYPRL